MATQTKPANSRTQLSQLKDLMSRHTAATYTKPANPTAAATPPPVARQMSAPATVPTSILATPQFQRYSIRLLREEIDRLDVLVFEAHQRLGKRVTISDLIRIGLIRVGANAPITADELAALRAADRRRRRTE